MKQTIRRGAIGVATALASLAFATSAHAESFYPPPGGSEFNSGAQGWFDQERTCTLIILPSTLCSVENVYDGANGISPSGNSLVPGSLRTNFTALVLLLNTVRGTGTWESPQFVVNEPNPSEVHFRVDRRAQLDALLDVGGTAAVVVRLHDATANVATTIFQESLTKDSTAWTQRIVEVPASLIKTGHRYAFRVITHVNGPLQALAGKVSVNFDNIVMRVRSATVGT
ncbi:MAG TPA: hypothetical protein VFZ89_18330 [Solirubrobacteraceae bacterium]